ncbi:MAG TPA: DUF5916 domain-containing protein [Vicinamibacteria bacterium]|nr:DUF5916 domain-containing protein [Vicinamibacteria bacterium]
MRTATIVLALVFVSTCAIISFASAQERDRRLARAARVDEAPVIDGVVKEAPWFTAEALTDFIQAEPYEGEPATEKTEVRIVYDSDTLYIAAVCYDSDPTGIVVTDSRRDSSLIDSDAFELILDTYQDRQNGFVFGTNPAGIEYDGQVSNEGEGGQTSTRRRAQTSSGGGFNLNWDASFVVRTQIDENGWSAEFAIPLRSLRYLDKPQSWGVNFKRSIRRKREEVYWSPVPRVFSLHRLSLAGDLTGLELETPRNLKLIPYALSSANRDYTDQSVATTKTDLSGEVGLDAKIGVTPSLNLDATVNTDFAQVEVDDQQINLTRFNLFFPEKRPFFLENAGTFSMGTGDFQGRSLELFFSRRIGIGPSGELVPIQVGGRLSGKVGSYNIGVMNMQTDGIEGVTPANNYTVGAISRELPNRSSVGALFVNRLATGNLARADDWNRTWGVDGQLGIGQAWTIRGFAARTETPGNAGREHALDVYAEYSTIRTRAWLEYTEVGDDFNPEVGFLLRDDYRTIQGNYLKYIRVPSVSWLRELRPHVTARSFWDFEGFQESEEIHIDSHVEFENGAYFSPAVNLKLEGLKLPFEIAPGIVIPIGTYRYTELAWRWNTDESAWLSYNGTLDAGGFFSGNRASIGTTINVRYGAKLNTSLTWSYNDVDLAEGAFVTNLAQLRVSYSFTPSINLQSLIQYNDQNDIWSTNVRFGWLNTAGTGLFIVYNDTEGLGNMLIGPQNRSFIVKYTHQFDVLR